jgi:hypothetical protein
MHVLTAVPCCVPPPAVLTARYDSKYDDKKDYDKYSKDSKYEK